MESDPSDSTEVNGKRQMSDATSRALASMWQTRSVRFGVGVLATGYGLFLLGKLGNGIDDDFLCFTTPAVMVAIIASVVFHLREFKGNHRMLLCYAVLFAVAFPLARESTHYDPIQVPMSVTSVTLSLFFFLVSLAVWLRNRRRDQIEYHI